MKAILLFGHVLSAVFQVLLIGFLSRRHRHLLIKNWSRILLKIFNVQVRVVGGDAFLKEDKNYLMVSNHISWLDIYVIHSIQPVIFVAKSDVARWPVFGWLAARIGTVFIQREKLSDIKRVLTTMKNLLQGDEHVCIFPEGTSSDGQQILPYRSNLFQAAIDANKEVQPLLIRYIKEGRYCDAPAFIGDMGLIGSIGRIISSRGFEVVVHVMPTIEPGPTRQVMSQLAYDRTAAELAKNFQD